MCLNPSHKLGLQSPSIYSTFGLYLFLYIKFVKEPELMRGGFTIWNNFWMVFLYAHKYQNGIQLTRYTSSNENSNCKKHASSFIRCKKFPKFQNYHVSKCTHFLTLQMHTYLFLWVKQNTCFFFWDTLANHVTKITSC
jgi:hypothetical protein